ncbi:MAG TPA: hypothetical protein VJ728_13920 [Candidatus Binataceae bacterium]|nr:hypothetical protein [Candidatus Binataceae bacterium]
MVKAIRQNAGFLVALALAVAGATMIAPKRARAAGYLQTNLVSNGSISAPVIDPNLSNPWGMALFPGGPFWVADNNAGVSTLYDGLGNIVPLVSCPINNFTHAGASNTMSPEVEEDGPAEYCTGDQRS